MFRENNMLPGQEVELLALGRYKIPLPLAVVLLELESLGGTLKVGVLDGIPIATLVGNDI